MLKIIRYYYLTYLFNKIPRKLIYLIFFKTKSNNSIFKTRVQKIKKYFKEQKINILKYIKVFFIFSIKSVKLNINKYKINLNIKKNIKKKLAKNFCNK